MKKIVMVSVIFLLLNLFHYNRCYSLEIDHQGNIVNAKIIGSDINIFKFANEDGSLIWKVNHKIWQGFPLERIVFDKNGDVIASGPNPGKTSFFIAKYNGENGSLVWEGNF